MTTSFGTFGIGSFLHADVIEILISSKAFFLEKIGSRENVD